MSAQVAVLFWFYRDLPVCRNRLALLRRDNPDTAIFGLFGGEPAEAARFRRALEPHLDDFWAFDGSATPRWKWLHGDLLLAAWFEGRGRFLQWDHVFIAQWDMLLLQPLHDLLTPLAADDVLLCGVRPVARIEQTWPWTSGDREEAYRAFVRSIDTQYGTTEPMSCVFIVACLPRRLLAAYKQLHEPEIGFVEYRLPTLATAIGLHLVEEERLAAWRPADVAAGKPTRRQRFLNAAGRSVRLPTILAELVRHNGARAFHPYHGLFPLSPRWAAESPFWATYVAARAAGRSLSVRMKRMMRVSGTTRSRATRNQL